MEENVIKRFGDLTLMNVCFKKTHTIIMICENDKFNNSVILELGELELIISLCHKNYHYLDVSTVDYNYSFAEDCIMIEHSFGQIEFPLETMENLVDYIRKCEN